MIDSETVKYVAGLARLKLTDSETAAFTRQLADIVEHMKLLDEVDTEGVQPTSFLSPGHDPLREDMESVSLPLDEVLWNGPSVKKPFFAVPKVIGQG